MGGELDRMIERDEASDHAKNLHFTLGEPYGVVGRIIPFNHPIKFAANALAAPLMAGNTVVLKPPETSPLSATMLGEISREVLPAGGATIPARPRAPAGAALALEPPRPGAGAAR